MSDTKKGGSPPPGEKEANKPPSPKPDQDEVAPPLISLSKDQKEESKDEPQKDSGPAPGGNLGNRRTSVAPARPGQPKKGVVLSGEAMKEMQKQAKATKDERRLQMDGRHHFLFAKLADTLSWDIPAVEDAILGDDKFDLIENFFVAKGSRKLLFFYQEASRDYSDGASTTPSNPQKKLFLTTGTAEGCTGLCFSFLRPCIDNKVTVGNISSEVSFMWMDCTGGKLLQGFESMMARVMVPALKSQESWGSELDTNNGRVSDFLEQLDQFVNSLEGARGNMSGHVTLADSEVSFTLESMSSAAEYQAAANNSEMLEKLEELLAMWARQIEQVLAESEQIRRETDDIGPNAELGYWKSRMAKFNTLLEQIKSPRCKALVGVLNAAKSKSLRHWRSLDARITDAANEAKDNVKYLYTLDKFFGPLVKCNPASMVEHIPSLMNAIRMIYSISSYYNTSERMTSLFVKVTNQMISTCKAYINRDVSRIWEHKREVLLSRISESIMLNEEYQRHFHKTKERLSQTPNERQFEFSENYIFGKFDTFCKRLNKISDMINTMNAYSGLGDVRIEGIETIAVRYKTVVEATKKKNYDILDHRKGEFDVDYMEFKRQFDALQTQIQAFIDAWFERPLTTDQAIGLLMKVENISGPDLDLRDKYMKVLANYSRDLEDIRKLYQKQKAEPVLPRNLPPVAGKITWARQLYRRIETPMKVFKKKPDILKTEEAKKVIRNYNRMAAVLTEYEMLYHRSWFRAVEVARSGLNASLLVRHPETKQLYVNFDPHILELIQEAKYLHRLNLEIPEAATVLCQKAEKIKQVHVGLTEMLSDYERLQADIPPVIAPLMKPYIERVEDALKPGMVALTWASLNVDQFMDDTYQVMRDLEHLCKDAADILACRIEAVLEDMSLTPLCDLPEDDPLTVDQYLQLTTRICSESAQSLSKQSLLVESSVAELVSMLKEPLSPEELSKMEPEDQNNEPDAYMTLLNAFTQRNTEALVKCTRLSLDAMKRRIQMTNRYARGEKRQEDSKPPLFRADIVLAIPNVMMRPSLEDIQAMLNKSVQVILKTTENVPQWEHLRRQQRQQQKDLEDQANEAGDEVKINPAAVIKPLHKIVADHKDIVKIVIQLNSIVSTIKPEVQELLDQFSQYSELWDIETEVKVKEFMDTKPIMSEFDAVLRYFNNMEESLGEMEPHHRVGPLLFFTDPLKRALIMEAHNWNVAYGKHLNDKSAREMDEILDFFDTMQKRLSRPVKDLDDIRSHMAALMEIRESEIKIDMTISPVEEAYAMLNKYNLFFNDGNAERVDTLAYGWKLLKQKVLQVQNNLIVIQPEFKANLLTGVENYKDTTQAFYTDYDEKGPMVDGIEPREASDRLNIYQARFDELWRKYQTYSGGEELFGLSVTEYPDLQRIRKELNLLQKLYSLYNDVLEKVNGYFDIAWVDINIEKINTELLDFQNKCRKLPKALKEWQAYEDLRKTIDDFNETCPLLEMMANRAMMTRHWQRIATLTGHTFDVESDNFLLRNLMEAPLLPNKEDIEDICISAVKEKDIEAKLKLVVNDWSAQVFQFSQFKSRGELLLKGDATSEIVALMEDSLMVLGSLMSNRYNAPFKPQIQEWVQKLTGTTEIIENWLVVQNLWIYLEAVFVGGDIAKQLPQEAKRFSNIDKSWQKIMQRAHENPNVVGCCMGDDTLSQLLPHLLEQLEICQKSLTGYLEKKRLLFPRFFFVSDPALLEILGQASDSHTIQAHLLSVFDNTRTVTFDDKVYDKILSINSQEGETVQLENPVMAQVGHQSQVISTLVCSTHRGLSLRIGLAYKLSCVRVDFSKS